MAGGLFISIFPRPIQKHRRRNNGTEQLAAENLLLREAVQRRTVELEHQNRELEIEAAMESVRVKTMAMQRSEELAEVAVLLFEQIKNLGINSFSSGFNIWDDDIKTLSPG